MPPSGPSDVQPQRRYATCMEPAHWILQSVRVGHDTPTQQDAPNRFHEAHKGSEAAAAAVSASPILERLLDQVPELESYQWTDYYFNESTEVTAVFDHIAVQFVRDGITAIVTCLFCCTLFLVVIMFAFPSSNIFGPLILPVCLSTAFGHIVSEITMCCLLPLWTMIFPPAHTAITREGLVHVTSVGQFKRCGK
jgi:hypothetical protein